MVVPLDVSPYFPGSEVTHIVSFAIAMGTVALLNFRLLRLPCLARRPRNWRADLRLWTLVSLCVAIFPAY